MWSRDRGPVQAGRVQASLLPRLLPEEARLVPPTWWRRRPTSSTDALDDLRRVWKGYGGSVQAGRFAARLLPGLLPEEAPELLVPNNEQKASSPRPIMGGGGPNLFFL